MRITVKFPTEDWLFARKFAYIDRQHEPYIYQKNIFKRKKENEPNKDDKIPYLIIDEVGLMINQTNEKGKWMKWNWEDTKSIRIFHLMHPWKASIYDWMHQADYYRERRKDKRYFRCMRWKYKKFKFRYHEGYENQYSLILEGKKGNGQFWIPNSWITDSIDSMYLEKIEEVSGKKIKYFNSDDDWTSIMDKKNAQE